MKHITLYITASNESEAQALIRPLIEQRLIACANILPTIKSLYWWNDEIQEDQECAFIVKTTSTLAEKVTNEIIENHSYDCPCVIHLPIEGGNPSFLKWIETETTS